MAKTKQYEIYVTRNYIATDTITVEASTEQEAIDLAEKISGDKDYTGQLELDNVEIDVYSEKEV